MISIVIPLIVVGLSIWIARKVHREVRELRKKIEWQKRKGERYRSWLEKGYVLARLKNGDWVYPSYYDKD